MDIFSFSKFADMAGILKDGSEQNQPFEEKDTEHFGIFRQLAPPAAEKPDPELDREVAKSNEPDGKEASSMGNIQEGLSVSASLGQLIRNLAEENQTRKILAILNASPDLKEAIERVGALLP